MVETVVCELFGGDLGGKGTAAPIDSAEIGMRSGGIVVGDA